MATNADFPLTEEACPHCWDESALRVLPAGQAVSKDDCAYCCRTAEHPGGILVCCSCFIGTCPQHASKHFGLTHHPMYVVVKQLPPKKLAQEDDPNAPKDTNMLGVAEPPEFETSLVCWSCRNEHIPGVGVTFDCFSNIVSTTSVAVSDAIAQNAWYSNRVECQHVAQLVQLPSLFPAGVVPGGSTPCTNCDSDKNNWMCLTCGNVGCPRVDAGGKAHAIAHHTKFNGHPVVVKLGTATAAGTADLYCYACDNEVRDGALGAHLAHFGIDLKTATKTSKSLGEMEYERTQQYDFGKITEASAALEPVFGPGKTGLRNFGNTCYMATVLQCLFSIKPFQARFLRQHRETCEASDPYKCCECQTERIAEGLLSGAFSNPADPPELRGVTPRAFKKLFTERHTDFSTMQQQDAQEFLIFLLKEFSRRMPIRDAAGAKKTPETDPTTVFDFVIEERQQCSACMAVRYKRHLQPNLSLSLPVLPFAGDKSKMTEEEIDASRPRTTLDACLAEMLLPGAIEGMVCPGCGTRAPFFTTSRLASFPDVFIFHARREYYDRNFQQVRKLDAYLDVPQELNLARLRSAGPQSDDVMLPAEADSSSATSTPSPAPMAVDETALAMMLSMGIDTLIAIWALQSTNNNVERAIDFVFSHPEGPPSIVTRQEDEPAAPASQTAVVAATDGAPNYRLSAMISHIGANAFSGHYVCHVLDECTGKWHLFNDEKVAVSQNPPFRMASIYFYKREGAAV